MTDALVIVFLSLGLFFTVIGAIGIWRLKNFFHRVHAPTKASTLGLIFLLAAVAFSLEDSLVTFKALLAVCFFAATAPVGAHLLARTTHRRGIDPELE